MTDARFVLETPCEHGQMVLHRDVGTYDDPTCPGGSREPASVADLVAALIAEGVLHYQHREVAGQNDDGSLNGQDYIEVRYVTEWSPEVPTCD